jgi:SAM-dependent methyltransferase
MTLAPENAAFWDLGISYLYGDLRCIDFRDDWFDAVTCISTIEHIGMDNAMYASSPVAAPSGTTDFVPAVRELRRVLSPGGTLYITFPYGRYENHGFFQQFDAALTDRLVDAFAPTRMTETIFRYTPEGWQLSDRTATADCRYFNVHEPAAVGGAHDYAAGARAVACLALVK